MADTWRPYVEACIENFGASRCMFESNFPVDEGACSHPLLINAFKQLAHGASASEKADLFPGTASRFYRLGNQRREQGHDRSADTCGYPRGRPARVLHFPLPQIATGEAAEVCVRAGFGTHAGAREHPVIVGA